MLATCVSLKLGFAHRTDSSATSTACLAARIGNAFMILVAAKRAAGAIYEQSIHPIVIIHFMKNAKAFEKDNEYEFD